MKSIKQYLLALTLMLCSSSVILSQCTLTCLNGVDVLIPEATGSVEVTADMLLVGDYSGCPGFNPVVTIKDQNGITIANSPILDLSNAGLSYTYEVYDSSTDNLCWGLISTYSDGPIDMEVANLTSSIGAEVCVPIRVTNFSRMYSGEWSMSWDPSALKYVGLKDSKIAFLTIDDNSAASGDLDISWLEGGVVGSSTLPNNSSLMFICFEGLKEISNTEVCIGADASFQRVDNNNSTLVPTDVNVACGSVSLEECTLPCLPQLTVSLYGSDSRTFEAEHFLLHNNCSSDVTVSILDSGGTGLGNTITSRTSPGRD